MTKVREFINHVGYCNRTPFWTDNAILGFFGLGLGLGIIVGMSLLHICK